MSSETKDIVVFCTSWCGDCRTSKSILNQHNVPFLEKDIEADPKAMQEFLKMTGNGPHSVPRILFRQGEANEGMVTIETLVQPSPATLIKDLQVYGYITVKG